MNKIKICKLPLNERTEEGDYWAKVNGENIGAEGRAFFQTEAAARLAAYAYIHGVQPLADLLGVGKDWVYRRLSGETPIREKDELLIAQAMKAEHPAKRRKKPKSAS